MLTCIYTEIITTEQITDEALEVVTPRPRARASLAAAAIIGILLSLLYGSILLDLFNDWWTSPNLSFGLLIPPIAGYLFWLERRRVLEIPCSPDNRGLLVIAAAVLILMIGNVAAEFFLQRLSFVILISGLAWTFWGLRRLKACAFPLLLLTTMVPLPKIVYERISTPLQVLASESATRMVQAIGITAYSEGNVIRLADITLGVEEACSGLNSLSAMAVSALLLAFMLCRGRAPRFLVLAIAIPLCIAANIARIAITAVVADYNPRFAIGFYHMFSGWAVFLAGFGLLFGSAILASRILDNRDRQAGCEA